jgi:hypothetical protein
LFVKVHVDPVASLENTNEVPAGGLVKEKVDPHGFKKVVPFVILYGDRFVWSIGSPLESWGLPFALGPLGYVVIADE